MTTKLYGKDLAKVMSLNCDKMYTIYECQDFLDTFNSNDSIASWEVLDEELK